MQRRLRLAAVVGAAAALVLAASALAAAPMKGREYTGLIHSSPFAMRVLVSVNATGKKLRFTYWCGTGRAPTLAFGIPIDATGHFKHTKATGSQWVWKMAGRFTSPTTAFVSLNSIACGGSKGRTTLALKRSS
jgi:hypothetical protein